MPVHGLFKVACVVDGDRHESKNVKCLPLSNVPTVSRIEARERECEGPSVMLQGVSKSRLIALCCRIHTPCLPLRHHTSQALTEDFAKREGSEGSRMDIELSLLRFP